MLTFIRPLLVISAGALTYVFGEWDTAMTALLLVVITDYVTGIISAAIAGNLNSEKGFKGILKKVFIFLVVAAAAAVDTVIPATRGAVRASVCMFYIANETLSVLENAGEIGLPLPQALKSAVEKLRNTGGEKDA
ncbi:MAG: phage holin family protein [Clostridia bacterium]|nr:phage holin family protein [Clostridia bacterium]